VTSFEHWQRLHNFLSASKTVAAGVRGNAKLRFSPLSITSEVARYLLTRLARWRLLRAVTNSHKTLECRPNLSNKSQTTKMGPDLQFVHQPINKREIDMKLASKHRFLTALLFVSFAIIASTPSSAQASSGCYVSDPTRTPLNIRTAPNGRVFSTVRNGMNVAVLEYDFDNRGRRWARIEFLDRGVETRGWVIARFLTCS
jgi:hypothetical protein